MDGGALPERRRRVVVSKTKSKIKSTKMTNLFDAFKKYHFRLSIVKSRLARKADRQYVLGLLEAEYVSREIIQDLGRQWFMTYLNAKDVKSALYNCGFKLSIATELYDVIKPLFNTSYTYDQLFDVAFEYVLGKYDPIGKPHAPFLYEHPENVWFKESEEDQHFIVNIKNVKEQHIERLLMQHPSYSKDNVNGGSLFYHATNWRSHRSISNSIDHSVGRDCLDFGIKRSFYCTPNFTDALQWCRKKHMTYKSETCIIAFRLPNVNRLPYNVNIFSGINKEWTDLVQNSRLCNQNSNQLDVFDFVYGPMCANPENVADRGEAPVPHNKVKYQLCSKSDRGDQFLHQNMIGTFFIHKQLYRKSHERQGTRESPSSQDNLASRRICR
jgi:hypothetical protein